MNKIVKVRENYFGKTRLVGAGICFLEQGEAFSVILAETPFFWFSSLSDLVLRLVFPFSFLLLFDSELIPISWCCKAPHRRCSHTPTHICYSPLTICRCPRCLQCDQFTYPQFLAIIQQFFAVVVQHDSVEFNKYPVHKPGRLTSLTAFEP